MVAGSFCVFVVLSFVLAGLFNSICLLWGSGRANVSSTKCFFFFCQFSHLLSLFLEARSTFFRRLLHDTRPPAAFSSVFPSYRCKHWSCRLSVIGAWARAWEFFVLWCTWRPRSAFFRPCTVGSTASNLRLGGNAPPSGNFGLFPSLPAACFGFFCLFVFVLFSCFSGHSLLVFGSNFMGIFVG
jgi:hypothetical protein